MPPRAISICIPAYEMGGAGATYLDALLASLDRQSFRDFDVVVADQSSDGAVKACCAQWSDRMRIDRFDNTAAPRSASANVNSALDRAGGEILKILFQDDYLCADDALGRIHEALGDGTASWALCGSAVTRDGRTLEAPMVPRLNDRMHLGRNTVSSPSVLAIRRTCRERFDESLQWLMDVEYYHRLHVRYGPPAIIDDTLVATRLHDGQVSSAIDCAIQARELDHVLHKHRRTTTLSGRFEYTKRRIKTLWPR
jgi:glycosyltransferase involved in cell wall biosynthesis